METSVSIKKRGHFRHRFPAYQVRNFRIYFWIQLISFSGTRLQSVAQGYLIFQLTNSQWWLGLIAYMGTFPGALLTPFSGALTDRFDTRKVLNWTQIAGIAQASILGVLALLNILNRWEMLVLAFLGGLINVADAPARRAFVKELVSHEHLQSANSLNSGIVHGSQFIGPTLGGLLLLVMNPGWTFIVNAVSFFPVLFGLSKMDLLPLKKITEGRIVSMVWAGMKYSWGHKTIRLLVFIYGAGTGLGYSVVSILPGLAADVFHSPKRALFALIGATAVGAVVGAVCTSALREISARTFVLAGFTSMGFSLLAFSFARTLGWSFVALFSLGAGFTVMSSTLQTVIQHLSDRNDKSMGGRVMGVVTSALFSGIAIGSLVIGRFISWFGSGITLRLNAAALLALLAWMLFNRERIPERS